MAVYDRATKAVLPEEKLDMFCVYLKEASTMFGITYTREIYEKAIEQLPDEGARYVRPACNLIWTLSSVCLQHCVGLLKCSVQYCV